jgi:hypothetical protein
LLSHPASIRLVLGDATDRSQMIALQIIARGLDAVNGRLFRITLGGD